MKTTYNMKIFVVIRIAFMKMHYVTLLYWEGQFSPVTTSLRVHSHFPGSWERLFLKWNINTYDFVKAKREIPPCSDLVCFNLWQSNFNHLSNKSFLDSSSPKSLWPVSSAVFCQRLHGLFQRNFDKAGSYKKLSSFTCSPFSINFSIHFPCNFWRN